MKTESRISLLYFALGAIWILVSDAALFGILALPRGALAPIETYKGWLYVAVTSALLYLLLRRELRSRRQTEAALDESRRFAQQVIETVPDAVLVYDVTSLQTMFINAQVETVFGYTSDEARALGGDFWQRVIVPDDLPRVLAHRERLLNALENDTLEVEYSARHKSGELRVMVERDTIFGRSDDGSVRQVVALVRDITERKNTEAQLAYQANLFQSVSDAIISVDLNYCVTSWNQAATEIYGYTPEEAHGRLLRDLIHTEYPGVGREQAMRDIHQLGSWRGETVQQRKDGARLHVLTSSRLLRDRRGEPIGIVAINRDITEQKRLEADAREKERLQTALAQAVQTRALHTRFMSMVSHEFRTPLTTIQLSTEMLEHYFDRLSDTARQERLKQIQTEIQRLLTMLDDIMLVLKTEATRQHFRPEPFELVAFVRQIVADTQPASGDTHLLTFEADPAALPIEADPTLLRQAVTNLLSNARKYAPAGTPVEIGVRRNGLSAVIQVRDHGIGISEADQQHLFDAFYRGENVGNQPGTGLGLLIARQAVDLHNGTIEVESALGSGSTFTLSLPLRQN